MNERPTNCNACDEAGRICADCGMCPVCANESIDEGEGFCPTCVGDVLAHLRIELTDRKQLAETEKPKTAPLQGWGEPIPWSLHMRAYEQYVKRHGHQKALVQGHCRGGFHVEELDEWIPGWRDELDTARQQHAADVETVAELDLQLASVRGPLAYAKVAADKGDLEAVRKHVGDAIEVAEESKGEPTIEIQGFPVPPPKGYKDPPPAQPTGGD